MPAGQVLHHGLSGIQCLTHGEAGGGAVGQLVSGDHGDLFHVIQHVQQGQSHLVAALAEHAVAACHQVDGAHAAGTAGGCAVLVAGLTQGVLLFLGHGQFGGEGAVAHAGGVGLHDADGVVQLVAGDTGTDGCISTDDVGGGGVRVDTKVDIAQCAQLCLKQHLLAGCIGIGQILTHIADIVLEDGGILFEPCPHLVHADGRCVVAALHDQILGIHHGDQALLHGVVQMQQIAHAQGLFHVLVAVSVGNAALGGAELCTGLGQACLLQAILLHMVGHGDGCAVGNLQVCRGDLNALLAQLIDLAVQMMRVDDHAVAHNAHDVGAQDAGGQQV